MRALELFAGAGGAALGLEAAGFEHAALVERDPDACATLRAARLGPVVEADVRDLDAIEAVAGRKIDLLWASPPCQPFSTAGTGKGQQDDRDGWPWTVAAIDRFNPHTVVVENVRGLLSHSYFEEVILQQMQDRYPCVGFWLLNAADFGVPQRRRRVFAWASDRPLVPPRRTHGAGMFCEPWVTMGSALGVEGYVMSAGVTGQGRPTPMTRAAPTISTKGNAYLLSPAPTITTTEVKGTRGRHMRGGPDRGSDALWLATGRRRLTVEECAKLQGFPVGYPFQGAKYSRYRQVGNAVPPKLAEVVARATM
jgi:DNA (cytosine-5)-methyltransferase 1